MKKMTRRERRAKRVGIELLKLVTAAVVFILCMFAVLDLYMGDFFSIYDKHMHIIVWKRIVRYLMYDALFAIQVLCVFVIAACSGRVKYDVKMILAD